MMRFFSILLLLFVVPALPETSSARAANPDESQVQQTLYVNKASTAATQNGSSSAPYKTIMGAVNAWNRTTPTKILVYPGTYRETVNVPGNNSTLLVIEGTAKGSVVVSGSDEYTPAAWTSLGDGLYSHPWTENFGNYDGVSGKHNPSKLLGHRREMVFINGQLQNQVILEDYTYTPNTTSGGQGTWAYKGFLGTGVLGAGTFGVAELGPGDAAFDANSHASPNRIFIKLPAGVTMSTARIEVAVRANVFNSGYLKHNLVLRNLVFEHGASQFEIGGTVRIGGNTYDYKPEYHVKDILMQDCDIRWGNGHGLAAQGCLNFNLQRVRMLNNGVNGIGAAYVQGSVWEDVETSYNNWRAVWGGGYPWALAATKIKWCSKNMTHIRHKSVGNASWGFWIDGNNFNNTYEGFTLTGNTRGMHLEISEGPLKVNNANISDNTELGLRLTEVRDVTISNSTLANNGHTQIQAEVKDAGRTRDVPEEYRGPNYTTTIYMGKINLWDNDIYTTKGTASYLITPRYDSWGAYNTAYQNNFLNNLTADSNYYYNPATETVFGKNVNPSTASGERMHFWDWKVRLKAASTGKTANQELNSTWGSTGNGTAMVTATDPLNDWTKIFFRTTDWKFYTQAAGNTLYEGDLSLAGRTTATTQSLVYRYYGMRDFTAKLFYHNTLSGVQFYASPDNVIYTPVASVNGLTAYKSGGWYRTVYSPSNALPAGTNYLKVEISNTASAYAILLSQIAITYNSTVTARTVTPEITASAGPEHTLRLHPNPAAGQVAVSYAEPGQAEYPNRLTILNGTGQAVQEKTIRTKPGINRETLDVSPLPAGVYLVRLEGGKAGPVVRKLYITR